MPILHLLFNPIINDTINFIACGFYLLIIALILTAIYEHTQHKKLF